MKLNIVSRPDIWPASEFQNGMNVPASVPALQELQRMGVRMTTTSDWLTPKDYQKVWRESYEFVWRALQGVKGSADPEEPDILRIHAYSLFTLCAQVAIVERFLDTCAERLGVKELHIENPADFPEEDYVFFDGVYTSYFHEVAQAWSCRRGCPCSVLPPHAVIPRVRPPTLPIRYPTLWPIYAAKARSLFRNALARLAARCRNFWYLFRGNRCVIFYLPFSSAGLERHGPGYAVDISGLLRRLAAAGDVPSSDGGSPPLPPDIHPLVRRRFESYLRRTQGKGRQIFRGILGYLRRQQQRGRKAAFLTTVPYVDWDGIGYATEAFRKCGCKIGGIQHGGNTRLVKEGGLGTAMTELLADFYFQWGNASTDEHETYGIGPFPVSFVKTGSPNTWHLSRRKRDFPRKSGKPSILYAPTLIIMSTTFGNNLVWDRYLGIFQNVCALLNASPHTVWVKMLPFPEMCAIHLQRYSRLRFLWHGTVKDYMGLADFLLADSLGGSPIYEALAADKPLLAYTGIENQRWDEEFLRMLEESAICFHDADSYLRGVREFLTDPFDYWNQARRKSAEELRRIYFPPVPPSVLWSTVFQTFFGPPALHPQ